MWSECEARDRVRKTSRKSPEFSVEYGLLNPLSDKLLFKKIQLFPPNIVFAALHVVYLRKPEVIVLVACVASVSSRVIARNLEREQKKKRKGGGGREERKSLPHFLTSFLHSPPPPPSFLFLLSFQFSQRTRAEPLATQAIVLGEWANFAWQFCNLYSLDTRRDIGISRRESKTWLLGNISTSIFSISGVPVYNYQFSPV